MNKIANAAERFLCERNPIGDYYSHNQYALMILNFRHKKGDDAIIALAGFYLFAIKNIKDEQKQNNAIVSTFMHDLCGADDKFMLPRSDAYSKYWNDEFITIKNNHNHETQTKD